MAAPSSTRCFPREIAALPAIFDFVDEYLEHVGWRDRAHDANLVVEEIFTNLVRHNRGEREIEVALSREGSDLIVTLRDFDVDPFDPTLPAATAATGGPGRGDVDTRAGGRGILLVKRLTKEFRYHYADRTSTLTTRLGAAGPQET